MEINLEQLKKNFITIKDIRDKVTNIFTILESHLLNLKKIYGEFVENNRQNLFVFGLDSFQFQSKLIDIEYDDMKRLFLAINNRMYCEYYKLYKIISEYVKENIQDKKTQDLIKITNIFPVYKDLEPYKQYKFEMIHEIHENIILLLYEINESIINKENELQIHKKKQEIGLNINNFVTTFNYNIIMIKEKGMLFISYIEFFHNLHTKYLQRFTMKMNLMYTQVTHDIRFEDGPKSTETKKQELIKDYETENIDKSLIRQIKRSFDDTDSNSSDTPKKSDNSNDESSFLSKKNLNMVTQDARSLKLNNITKEVRTEFLQNTEDMTLNSSISGKYKNLIPNNVKKFMKNMSLFKKKKDSSLSGVSSESSINNIESKSQELDIIVDLNKLEKNIELVVEDNINGNINRTKSAEEIFMEISKQCEILTDSFLAPEKKNEDMIEFLDIYDLRDNENMVESILVKDNMLELNNEIEPDIKDVMDKIIKEVENRIITSTKEESKDMEDETISVITMESLHNEKPLESGEQKELISEEKKDDDNIKKKKRTYKPRKKNV
jgi:hypothetical protein